ncbi:hypothetical protein GLAREA_04523 [Glarea lozoyensis ATCC 20868]|uniref:Uncharacterized protein n=1 Tax=Glarea lozoyensis (strain ATCC 20868 / MF5171) TaxID=1116229 RepID=S3CML2_GLAL2|nr:uncharacterized protein GLAREA_04523 [Glarea lozoyensis ATCC 20868]EPE27732.1 hypothetical protein GLAREA_04523 [Glarea lozoyensis ATCC 20868]
MVLTRTATNSIPPHSYSELILQLNRTSITSPTRVTFAKDSPSPSTPSRKTLSSPRKPSRSPSSRHFFHPARPAPRRPIPIKATPKSPIRTTAHHAIHKSPRKSPKTPTSAQIRSYKKRNGRKVRFDESTFVTREMRVSESGTRELKRAENEIEIWRELLGMQGEGTGMGEVVRECLERAERRRDGLVGNMDVEMCEE